MERQYKGKQLAVFLITNFIIAFALEFCATYFYLKGSTGFYQLLLMVTMFAPMIAVLISGCGLKGMMWIPDLKDNKVRTIKYFIAAWFLPLLLTLAGAVLYFLLFSQTFDTTGKYLEAALGESGMEALEASGMTANTYILISVIATISYAPLTNAFLAIGEEVGWRGFLYPMFKDRYGKKIGRILGGFIWGLWHWPLIILCGYEYGTDYIGAPYAGPLLFLVFTTVFGIILDHWYEKGKCILIPAIGHGALNAAATLPYVYHDPDMLKYSVFGPAPIGIIAMIPMIIYVVYIMKADE